MPKKIKDIKPLEFPSLLWEANKIAESLELLYQYVINYATTAGNWYAERRSTKKLIGFWLRLGAVIGTAIAGIIPILGEIFKKDNVPLINPAWSTVAIALVALFIAIDNFGGYTSGWIRYMLTGQKIDKLITDFRFQWEKNKLTQINNDNVSLDLAAKAVETCELFLSNICEEVRNETEAWAAEFQSAIKEIEKTAKIVSAAQELGAIDLEVANGDECENGWTVKLDNEQEKNCQGKFGSLTDLTPKIHTVRIEGKIAGKYVTAEKSVLVIGGQVVPLLLRL